MVSILKKPGVRKKPYLVRTVEDVLLMARNMVADSLAPIFLVSSVTGRWVSSVTGRWVSKVSKVSKADESEQAGRQVVTAAGAVESGVGTEVVCD